MAVKQTRRADVVWEGNLLEGKGTLNSGTGVIKNLGLSWSARADSPGGKTSPEELIAAAHASCFAMALSNTLATGGHAPQRLAVSAVVHLVSKPEGGVTVSKSELSVTAKVPGLTAAAFADFAKKGEAGCPVSNALRGNVEITLDAKLEN